MTDNEVIKALKKIAQYSGFTDDVSNTLLSALDLINRQQKEIDRLERYNEILSINADTAFQDGLNEAQDLYAEQVKAEIKSEAIKDFAERLKRVWWDNRYDSPDIDFDYFIDLVKEMVGEE